MFTWHSAFQRVIRLPRRSRAKAGAIRGSLKRKSLSHGSPGKFERSSQNSFQKRRFPICVLWKGGLEIERSQKSGKRAAGNPLCGDDCSHQFADSPDCGTLRTQMLAATYKPGTHQIRKSRPALAHPVESVVTQRLRRAQSAQKSLKKRLHKRPTTHYKSRL